MSSRERPGRTPRLPLVLSSTALVVALFGSTPAGTAALETLQQARNSVGPQQVRTGAIQARHLATGAVTGQKVRGGAIQTRHVATGAVTGAKLRAGAIQAAHLAPASVTGEKVAQGSLRAVHFQAGELVQGAPGPPGPPGPPGRPGLTAGAVGGTTTSMGSLPRQPSFRVEVNVVRAGSLFVFGRVSGFVRCGASGSCGNTLILTVNGEPVATTGASIVAAAGQRGTEDLARFGLVPVRPGRHVVRWEGRTGGPLQDGSIAGTVGAIVLEGEGG